MSKTHTLTPAEMRLLAEFVKANEGFEVTQKTLEATHPGTEEMTEAIKAYNKTFAARLSAGAIFASCVAQSVKEGV
jgi:hypothetical protein